MDDYTSFFKGKKITLMGLGLLGRGVGDAQFLAENCSELTVTDAKTEKELTNSLEKLKGYKNINFVLGEHRIEDFENTDLVIKAAGVPLGSPYIEAANKAGVPVKMSTALFAELSPATIVGITGTRGKTTVAHLIYEIFKNSGKDVFLGGNIKGVSTLQHLLYSKKEEIAVLELDSWQLQGFGYSKISPHIAIFTSFLADHMDYYKNDMDAYLDDKANIFKYQKQEDVFVLDSSLQKLLLDKYRDEIKADVEVTDHSDISEDWNLLIPGKHSKANAACAIAAARKLNVKEEKIKEAVESFKGVSGRLEHVLTTNGVEVYNDTTSTTPDATVAALKALGDKKNIVLIAGGSDKGLALDALEDPFMKYCKTIVLLPGTGTEKLESQLDFKEINTEKKEAKDMDDAVSQALDAADNGDIVMLSPGFASFGLFINEYDRGERFLNALDTAQVK